MIFSVVVSKIFLEFSPLFGEDEPILTHIFQRGWNHLLDDFWITGPTQTIQDIQVIYDQILGQTTVFFFLDNFLVVGFHNSFQQLWV